MFTLGKEGIKIMSHDRFYWMIKVGWQNHPTYHLSATGLSLVCTYTWQFTAVICTILNYMYALLWDNKYPENKQEHARGTSINVWKCNGNNMWNKQQQDQS